MGYPSTRKLGVQLALEGCPFEGAAIVTAVPLPEKWLLQQIARRAQRIRAKQDEGVLTRKPSSTFRVAALIVGIGDDCAVLRHRSGPDTLITTDFSLEGVHFRRQWHPPESVGHRCLARGLSDIAAMGGLPVAAFLSLGLPSDLPQPWVDRFLRGLLDLAKRFSTPLAGGDVAQSSEGVLADIVVLGSVPRGRAVLRSGARAGDLVYVTGRLGASALMLSRLRRKYSAKISRRENPAHFFPTPRVAIGRFLREKRIASAMIDLSDGLSTDLDHICEQSGVGARIYAERIPSAAGAENFALNGGEDYELLFTARPRVHVPAKIAGVPVTQLGEIIGARKVWLVQNGREVPLHPGGWEHFRKS